jgi:shikimate kinase
MLGRVTAVRAIHNLALIGFMGSGKTTIGQYLAAQLHFEFVDTDHLIEAAAGKTIPEIFAAAGESTFRELESRVVGELAKRHQTVIATGGGLPCHGDNLGRLKSHAFVVCLWASPETVYERVKHSSHRPLLQHPDPLARIRELLAARESHYRDADLLISSDGRPSREIVQHILHEFQSVRQCD